MTPGEIQQALMNRGAAVFSGGRVDKDGRALFGVLFNLFILSAVLTLSAGELSF